MSYGIPFKSSRFFLASLAASVIALAGCDNSMSPPAAAHRAGTSLLDPSDNGRQRDDYARGLVWILNSQGAFIYYTATGKLVEITLPSWQWVDTPYACPPDLALGPNGEAVVTSNVVPVLWRIDPRSLAVSVHQLALDADNEKDVGFSKLVYSAEQGAWFATSETHGSMWRIDPLLRMGRKVTLTEPARGCGTSMPRGE